MNKKIASEIAVGIILIIAIVVGVIAWMQGKEMIGKQAPISSIKETQINPQKENESLANPASTFCIEHGGKSEIQTNADGSQSGNCVFEDGNKCDEWAYFRGECSDKSNGTADGQTYVNVKNGFSIQLPQQWTTSEESLDGNTIVHFSSPKTKDAIDQFNAKGEAGEGPTPDFSISVYKNTEKTLDAFIDTQMLDGKEKTTLGGKVAYAGTGAGFTPTYIMYTQNKGNILEFSFGFSIDSLKLVQTKYPFLLSTFKFD